MTNIKERFYTSGFLNQPEENSVWFGNAINLRSWHVEIEKELLGDHFNIEPLVPVVLSSNGIWEPSIWEIVTSYVPCDSSAFMHENPRTSNLLGRIAEQISYYREIKLALLDKFDMVLPFQEFEFDLFETKRLINNLFKNFKSGDSTEEEQWLLLLYVKFLLMKDHVKRADKRITEEEEKRENDIEEMEKKWMKQRELEDRLWFGLLDWD